jgi:hypothetical protein
MNEAPSISGGRFLMIEDIFPGDAIIINKMKGFLNPYFLSDIQ